MFHTPIGLPLDVHFLELAIAASWPAEHWGVTALVAVSGGPDSVALLRALARLRPREAATQLVVAHFNHGWRGEESDQDQAFVEKLSLALGLRFEAGRQDACPTGQSEASARAARYAFLLATAHRVGARYVALGHTADDQAETILFRLLRGTGLSGLTGIPALRRLSEATTLVRPMLWIRRSDVLDYLRFLDQPFRIDASNADTRFERNRLRHEVLPRLAAAADGDVTERLLELGRQAEEFLGPVRREAVRLLELAEERRSGGAGEQAGRGERVVLCVGRVPGDTDRHIVREMFVELWKRRGWPRGEMTFARWDELAEMAAGAANQPTRMFPGGIRAERCGSLVRLERV